jgi:predicted nucleic acid-binding protein
VNAVFADTFYWVALTNPEDSAYRDALALDDLLAGATIVTTDEILTEFTTYFAADPWLRRRAAITARRLLTNRGVHVIAQSRESFLAGLSLYETRPDKGYSLTDCISMQTMRREGIAEVLTNDRHFEQEGFRAMFRVRAPGD